MRFAAALSLIALAGCAVASAPDDAAVSTSTGDLLAPPHRDGGTTPLPDGSPGADGPTVAPCTLGSADHCGTCATICPPGADDDTTHRTCSLPTAFGTCDIICKGEYYDVDGKTDNGCEELDQPVQDSAAAAVVIMLPSTVEPPDGGFTTNPRNVLAKMCGDQRDHDAVPTERPQGREDWYKLQVAGGGAAGVGVTACLGITNFPADDQYELCLAGNPPFITVDCMNVTVGPSVCKSLAAQADETGVYYARVRKLMGTNTNLKYALFLKH